jgi:hypothetical protein
VLLLEIEPGLLDLPSGRVLEIASMVVMTDDSTGVTHDRTGFPCGCTVHAPQSHPAAEFRAGHSEKSRSTQRSGVSPSTSTLPLTSLMLIACGIAYASRIARYRGLDLPLILARPALGAIRAASQHFRHCCPGWPDAGGPRYLCV